MVSLAFSRNKEVVVTHESEPKKLVIISGPTFGTIAGLLFLGVALGAAGVVALRRGCNPHSEQNSLADDLMGVDANRDKAMIERANALIRKVKVISTRARNTVQFAGEALAPRVQSAITEAKQVPATTEQELHHELDAD